jgi:PKD repeat protein
MKQNRFYIMAVLLLLMAATSCKKEKENGNLKAVYSYVSDGFRVTFTNFSTGAKEYHWDFNDRPGDTSNLKSPQHIFSRKGDFLVTLTAINGSMTDSFTDTVYIAGPNIKIDGDFSDWEHVEFLHVNPDGVGGTIRGIKAFATSQDINFMLEGTTDMKLDLFDMYIDSDNNPATGYFVGAYPAHSGMDYLLEGPGVSPSWGAGYKHAGGPGDWAFNAVFAFDGPVQFSAMKTESGKNYIEFSVRRSELGSPSGSINFAFVEMNEGWAEIGRIPKANDPDSRFLELKL